MQVEKECPVCHHPIKFADSVFCGNCGHRLIEEQPQAESNSRKCPRCKNLITNSSASFCGICGYNLNNTESMNTPATGHQASTPTTTNFQQFPQFAMNQLQSSPIQENIGLKEDYILHVKGNFTETTVKVIAVFSFTLLVAHFFRYLLVYNTFPSFYELWTGYIFYLIFASLAIYSIMYYYNTNGVAMNCDVDNYDYTFSAILSSFFISTLSLRVLVNIDKSTLPEVIRKTVYEKKKGYSIQSIDRNTFIGKQVRPLAYRMRVYIVLGYGYAVFFLQGILDPALTKSTGLVIGFIAAFSLLETEYKGRNKDLIKKGQNNIINVLITIAGFILLALSFGTDSLASLGQIFQ